METVEQRSRVMRAVKSSDTRPEKIVRHILHAMGYRYRLHRSDLPGKPDIVFGPRRKLIFVHGCFWHGHQCARGARTPKNNVEYWSNKIARNVTRDGKHLSILKNSGWTVLILWECELRNTGELKNALKHFLDADMSGQLVCRAP